MFGTIGLALGALSTVSSLIDQATAGINQAVSPPAPAFSVNASAASAAQSKLGSAALNPGPPIPKFDQHTHAVLLSLQEQPGA